MSEIKTSSCNAKTDFVDDDLFCNKTKDKNVTRIAYDYLKQ